MVHPGKSDFGPLGLPGMLRAGRMLSQRSAILAALMCTSKHHHTPHINSRLPNAENMPGPLAPGWEGVDVQQDDVPRCNSRRGI